MKRIEWGRRAEVIIKDAMVFSLVDDEKPEASPSLIVAFDTPAEVIISALREITQRLEQGIATMKKVCTPSEGDK